MAEGLPDQRRQPAFEHALGEFIGDREQRGVGDQRQRLGALEPVLVLGLEAVGLRTKEMIEHAGPHCGKIGRYISHRARSLTVPRMCDSQDGREGIEVPSR